ncbi:hypothetical protein [Deinococcus hopiensis]|uniref:Uncharacterized protein n=1 Tax=Deinococcus hopiensis KR-140 TaxID=695939 RepID=A0A1W1VIX2_9DEIO|nr:hypothetical protein [Deinococcus hopiensis]SMB93312.1 hypothetical protein SAMN00790413_01931 [Deinococcus hopiensis KR-140]
MDELSPEMQATQDSFQEALGGEAWFFYPYRLTPSPGVPFWGNVWAADPRGRAYAAVVQRFPDLAGQDVRFLTVSPEDEAPGEGAIIPHDGGRLTLLFWGQLDATSGESIGCCTWSL